MRVQNRAVLADSALPKALLVSLFLYFLPKFQLVLSPNAPKNTSDSTGLNPFQRLAQKSTSGGATSAWSGFAQKKEESVEIKEEAEKEENDAEKTSGKTKEPAEKIVTGEEEEKNVLQVPCKLFQVTS
jgi:hypothetical protein